MKLAACGGEKVRTEKFMEWPNYSKQELMDAILSTDISSLYRGITYPGIWNGKVIETTEIESIEQQFSNMHNCKYGFFVNSGTVALDLAMKALKLKHGDEVLVTPYTFISSASVIRSNRGTPVFVDIDSKSLNIDVEKIPNYITKKTKAIVIVHFGGIPVNMEKVMRIANEYNLQVVEDCCHTMFAKYKNKSVGSFGEVGCFSFQNSKLLSCGEGGAIVTNNLEIAKYLFSLHNVGRESSSSQENDFRFLGNNFRYPIASLLFFKIGFKRIYSEYIQRNKNLEYFVKKAKLIEGIEVIGADLTDISRDCYIVAVRYKKEKFYNLSLKRLVLALNAEGIPCSIGYQKMLYDFSVLLESVTSRNLYKIECEKAERAKIEVLWLPHYLFLGNVEDMDDIIEAFCKVKKYGYELQRKRKR